MMLKKDDKGAWDFADTGWSEADQQAWIAAHASLDEARAGLSKAETDRAAAAAAPASALLAVRLEAEAVRARTEREIIETADDAAELEMRAKYGARLRVVYTAAGRLILTWTDAHERLWDGVNARAKFLTQAALEASPPDPIKAGVDSLKAYKEGYFDHIIVHPPKEQARKILTSYPDTWDDLYVARSDLARGPREAAGKGAGL